MRMMRSILLSVLVLMALGCASGPAEVVSDPSDFSGLWSGMIKMGASSKLRCAGGQDGAVHLELVQDGNKVSGTVTGLGFRGDLVGFVTGAQVVGDLRYTAGLCGGGSQFSGTVSGNEMLVETVESKLIFSRAR